MRLKIFLVMVVAVVGLAVPASALGQFGIKHLTVEPLKPVSGPHKPPDDELDSQLDNIEAVCGRVNFLTAPNLVPNDVDDDGDGRVNDGCPGRGPGRIPESESPTACDNNADDDSDGLINDGCPAVGEPEYYFSQAGAHPDMRIRFDLCTNFEYFDLGFKGCDIEEQLGQVKDLVVDLPPGLLGSPAGPACPYHLFIIFGCGQETVVGFSYSEAIVQGGGIIPIETQLFNVETFGFEPARLGTTQLGASPPGPVSLLVRLRSSGADGDFGVASFIAGLPNRNGAIPASVVNIDTILYSTYTATPGAKPFFVNPSSCDTKYAYVSGTSYQNPTVVSPRVQSNPFKATGCDDPQATDASPTPAASPPFDLDVDTTPASTQAGAATSYAVKLHYPDYDNADIWQSSLRHAVVTLPDGVSLSPGGGVGLEACSFEQFYGPNVHSSADYALRNDEPVKCPVASQIGTVYVDSPALPEIGTDPGGDPYGITGKAFFGPATPGRPTADKPWKLFLLLEGAGLRLKLTAGDVTVNENGQVTTSFRDNPEVPFTTFKLITNDGPNAPLANPMTCGTHTGKAVLTSWGDTDPSSTTRISSPTVDITGCQDPQPFSPSLDDASTIPTQAGAFTTSHLMATRGDGQQLLNGLTIHLPVGAVGSLAAVPLCEYADVQAGTCGNDSKIGHLRSTVGYGDATLTVAGSIYLAKPGVPGDAATIGVVIPARVGPIDLGNVVLLNRIRLREADTGIDVISSDIPTIFGGVPLAVKKVEISTDRDGFFINPTGCDERTAFVDFRSNQGAVFTSSKGGAATGCEALDFSPKLRMIVGTKGLTDENDHPPLSAIVTQASGQSNIAKARVVLPDLIRPNVPQIQKPGALCNDAQLAARACPALSQVGTASVVTPVLPFSLSGPVYIVLKAGSPLPNLAVFLRGGGFEVVLTAGNGFQGIRILNTFDSVPDVPQSRFRLSVKGGRDGILLNHANLCNTSPLPAVDATFTGQNRKTSTSKNPIQVRGCENVSGQSVRLRILSKTVKVTKKRIAAIKLRCSSRRACKGKISVKGLGSKSYSIKGRKAKTVKVKVNRKGFRALNRKNRMRPQVRATVRGGKRVSKKITFKAPR